VLGNQNPIFTLDFQSNGLDYWNYNFQNQTIEQLFDELDLLNE
jgi:hypothetical protein